MPSRRRFLLAAAAAAPALAVRAQSSPENSPVPAPIAALKSRIHEAVPITLAEREARLVRAQKLLHTNKMDAVVITNGSSLAYFSGLQVNYQSEPALRLDPALHRRALRRLPIV